MWSATVDRAKRSRVASGSCGVQVASGLCNGCDGHELQVESRLLQV